MVSDWLVHLAKNINIPLTPKGFCKSFRNKRQQERERGGKQKQRKAERWRKRQRETERQGERLLRDLGSCLRLQKQTQVKLFLGILF